jgi:2-aminoethylphosphonate-pyruvate transaminase
MYEFIPDNPYILLTPGPLSTSKGVRNALLRDWCTWDADYNEGIVQNIRKRLVALAVPESDKTEDYTAVLMQGSGSFGVESVLTTAIPENGKVLIIANGAYGKRMVQMAETIKLNYIEYPLSETEIPQTEKLSAILAENPDITHISAVHCETTTGILNPVEKIAEAAKKYNKILIIDGMSSFGGIPLDVDKLGISFLISSSNKCIQGVPGFSFVIAKRDVLESCKNNARSLCLNLYDQWKEMDKSGKWRYTSPTHIVRAFYQALDELEEEGGVSARYARYRENNKTLIDGMRELGFVTLLDDSVQSPIITSFLYPSADFNFTDFYTKIKERGFVLYPGKISKVDTFRIGNIGDVYPDDIKRLLGVIKSII